MSKKNPKVLVIATSRKTRGGITAVVKAHELGAQWEKYHCKWIETNIDSYNILKIIYFLKALLIYLLLIPFYDIVHIHVSEVKRKLPFFILAKLLNKKTIVHLHIADTTLSFKGINHPLYHWVMSKADIVIVLSNQWKQILKEDINITNNVIVVFNPCSSIHLNSDRITNKIVLFAGTLIKRKGYADLIIAFSKIAFKYSDWKLQFAGNGEISNAKILASQLGIIDQVEFLGWISGSEKAEVFNNASIFCLPSYAEGFPMSVLDAWSYGIPVICTPVGGLPDIVKDGVNALLFDCGNIEKLAIQLERIISDDNLRKQIADKSLELSRSTFKLENINKKIGDLYETISKN